MPCGMLLGMQTPEITEAQKRQAIRDMLTKRYYGVIPVTDEMIDMVLDGLREEGAR
jgi:vacuolar-type H+-ATPase subunit F/Vma7